MVHKRAPQSIENFSIAHDSFDHEFDDWNVGVVATRDTCILILWGFFVCGFSSRSRIFRSYADFTMTGEGLQILTHAWHSWPLSSEGSLECHTFFDTGHPFIWSSPKILKQCDI